MKRTFFTMPVSGEITIEAETEAEAVELAAA